MGTQAPGQQAPSDQPFAGAFGSLCHLKLLRDASGRAVDCLVTDAAAGFLEFVGLPAAEVLSRYGSALFGSTQPPLPNLLEEAGRAGGAGQAAFHSPTLKRHVAGAITPLSKDAFILAVRELDDRVTAPGGSVGQSGLIEAVNRLLNAALRCEDETTLCRACLEVLEELSGGTFGWIGQTAGQGEMEILALDGTGAPSFPGDGQPRPRLAVAGPWEEVLRSGRPLCLEDRPCPWPGAPDGLPAGVPILAAPLTDGGKVFGLVGLGGKPGGFRPGDANLVAALAPTIVEVLGRFRLQQEVARHRGELQKLVQDKTTELTGTLAEMEERNQRFLSILNAHPETIYVVDPETFEVLFVNKCFRDLLGYDPVGRKCYQAFQEADAPCGFCTNDKIRLAPGRPYRWEFHNKVLDRYFDICDLLIPWSDGRQVRYELAVDITAHKITQRELETVIETSVDGYWVCDRQGRFLKVNDPLCRMLGYLREDLLQLGVVGIEDGLTGEQARQRLDRIAITGSERFETRHRRRDGTLVDVEVSATFLDTGGGSFHVFVRDISEPRRHEQERERLIEALGRSNAELEQFAYFASHDLQEPLRKVQAFGSRLATMLDDRLDEKSRDYLARILNSSERMQNLINDLLSYGRLSTRARPWAQVDLARTAQQVAADLEVRLEKSGGRLEIGDLPVIEAEPVQMHLLLLNLIGNGLKFQRPDVPPVVTVAAETTGDRVVLSVQDNGIGFDEKYTDRIFKLFQRLHGLLDYEGTGMGLAICQKIVDRHGGAIAAASRPGEGARFTVTLPLSQPRQEEPVP